MTFAAKDVDRHKQGKQIVHEGYVWYTMLDGSEQWCIRFSLFSFSLILCTTIQHTLLNMPKMH